MPFVFQSDALTSKVADTRNRIEQNINDAAFNNNHQPSTGVLNKARLFALGNQRPQTSKFPTKIRGLKEKVPKSNPFEMF